MRINNQNNTDQQNKGFEISQDPFTCQHCGEYDEILLVVEKPRANGAWVCSSCFSHYSTMETPRKAG